MGRWADWEPPPGALLSQKALLADGHVTCNHAYMSIESWTQAAAFSAGMSKFACPRGALRLSVGHSFEKATQLHAMHCGVADARALLKELRAGSQRIIHAICSMTSLLTLTYCSSNSICSSIAICCTLTSIPYAWIMIELRLKPM